MKWQVDVFVNLLKLYLIKLLIEEMTFDEMGSWYNCMIMNSYVNEMKQQVYEMASWCYVKFMNWQINVTTNWWIGKLTNWKFQASQFYEVASW
jgi:hypothetical protein